MGTSTIKIAIAAIALVLLSGCEGYEQAKAQREEAAGLRAQAFQERQQAHQLTIKGMELQARHAIEKEKAIQARLAEVEKAIQLRWVTIAGYVLAFAGFLWASLLGFRYVMFWRRTEVLKEALPQIPPEQRGNAVAAIAGPAEPLLLLEQRS